MVNKQDISGPSLRSTGFSAGDVARRLLRRADKAALATLELNTGHPYVSLVTLATDLQADALFMISRLARHTKNLGADCRASLLIEAAAGSGDPLAVERVTVIGRARQADDQEHLRRYLARHPLATQYAGFTDFSIYVLAIEHAHFIAGFGRILTLRREDICLDFDAQDLWMTSGPQSAASMNRSLGIGEEGLASSNGDHSSESFRVTDIDPDGFDFISGGRISRMEFAEVHLSPETATAEALSLAREVLKRP